MKKLFENVGENQFKVSEIAFTSNPVKHDDVGQFLKMLAGMDKNRTPNPKTWAIVVDMAKKTFSQYSQNQR